jgi:hypothetical protein
VIAKGGTYSNNAGIPVRSAYVKTLEQITSQYRSSTLDGRDLCRLAGFIPESQLGDLGITLKPECIGTHEHKPLTREAVLAQLEKDVAFGFEKALNRRGISSSLMYEVVSMWNWVLEEGLEHFSAYTQYGLPLFKATAIKYGFDNPIGDDEGDEYKYSEDGDDE